jgi:hypothetical protein
MLWRRNKQIIEQRVRKDYGPLGNISLVSGILSIPLSAVALGLPVGIIARITGSKGMLFSKTRGEPNERAWLGKLLGTIGIILSVIAAICWVVILFFAAILALISAVIGAFTR